ncbi:hypothetical protein AVEN_111729-1 [Araneus ventricosus]|uniref:Uncharacterized protein n=1 Tax=Araneus ventricosus TaxID=182803 RepID=A0A4Y2C9R8_ARAVE|nr:hypothetical protein AVEN_111729-1 [Araneus ventricosus]
MQRSFVFHRTWAFPFVSSKNQPCRNLILFLRENRRTNPLCYSFPPHNLLPCGTTQPITSASLAPQRRQKFKVKKEDPYSTFSEEKPVFFVQIPINCFFFFSIVFSVESNAIFPFPQSWPTFSQIATSVTEYPLPPAMREFKTNQTSTAHPASSPLHPFLWRWKVSFH